MAKRAILLLLAAVPLATVRAADAAGRPAMMTRWGEKVTDENAWRDYPRPQMVRENRTCLNGSWDYAITSITNAAGRPAAWDGKIRVPFPLEAPLSGCGGRLLKPDEYLWYSREVELDPRPGEKILLHFGAVDYRAIVFLGHDEVAIHDGGNLPFTADLTPFAKKGRNTLTVLVWDPTEDFVQPRGKQSFRTVSAYYTRVSGIWQSVWMETVPECHIADYKVDCDIDKGEASLTLKVEGGKVEGSGGNGEIEISCASSPLRAVFTPGDPVTVKLPRPVALWSPEHPNLYHFSARFGKDEIKGYFAMRKFEKRKDADGFLRFFLNNKPYYILGALDQGWWPDGLLTPPSVEAMAFDIKTLKDCGFNALRKHVKVEPLAFYSLCDKIGMLVLQDMPSSTHYARDPFRPETAKGYGIYREELKGMVDLLAKVPSIAVWIPYNEGWGQHDRVLTHATLDFVKRRDPSRLVDGPSGFVDFEGGEIKVFGSKKNRVKTDHLPDGECEAADLVDYHHYREPTLPPANDRRISFVGEFGGLGHPVDGHVWKTFAQGASLREGKGGRGGNWGYGGLDDTRTREGLEKAYLGLVDTLCGFARKGLGGSVYTQATDVELEINGLMTYDRKVLKFDPATLRKAHERLRRTVERRERDAPPPLAPSPVPWTFPRNGNCHEGMAFADGTTGVLAWGGGDTLKLTVGRADIWDHRGGRRWTEEMSWSNIVHAIEARDEARIRALFAGGEATGEPKKPRMLPLGRVEVKIPGATLLRGELDPSTGCAWIDFAHGGKTRRMEAAMTREHGGVFAVAIPEDVGYEAKAVSSMEFPSVGNALAKSGFEKPVRFENGFEWALPADPSVSLAFARRGGVLAVRTWRGAAGGSQSFATGTTPSFADIKRESEQRWAAFWTEGARVRVPDPVVQRIFDYGMYRFGAMTDPGGVPAGLQGPWLDDHRIPPWSGDYHFDVNVEECYSPAFRGGHAKNLLPLFRMVLSWRGKLRDNARKFAGIDDGFLLPVNVDDRCGWIGGYWPSMLDNGCTAWVADMMWRYVKYSGDVAALRDGLYDFMKGAMNVYIAMLERRDGRLALPWGPSPEWGSQRLADAVGRNPSFQLAAAHKLARDLIEAAERLGEAPDPRWLEIEAKLPSCSQGRGGIDIFEGVPLSESHRHHSHMAGLYPFDTLDPEDPEMKPCIDATFRTWTKLGTGLWSGWCLPWASILRVHAGHPQAAVAMLKAWDGFYCDEGHGSHHNPVRPGFAAAGGGRGIMQMDGQCGAATAVMELLVHEVNGKLQFFRGCPPEWQEVAFENIALSDGRRVSGRRIGGVAETWHPAP